MSAEEFLINAYKHMDAMKGQIKARYAELNGCDPSTEELARQCWDVWRLTTFYVHALADMSRDAPARDHASYIPPVSTFIEKGLIRAFDETGRGFKTRPVVGIIYRCNLMEDPYGGSLCHPNRYVPIPPPGGSPRSHGSG